MLKIHSCAPLEGETGSPGVVLRADEHGIVVGAGHGAVLLRDIQLEGKKRMPAGDFLRGHPLAPGAVLGGA